MRILVVKPHSRPKLDDIPHTLEAMQETVGGYIEIIAPFDDEGVVLVCDDEGKIKGYELNRVVGHDIIAGTFFLAGADGEDLTDLPDDLAEKYEKVFEHPQVFIRTLTGILALSSNGEQMLVGDGE